MQILQSPEPFGFPTLPALDTLVDTIRVIDQQAYIDLLERTNQQMSYWWGPIGAAIAFLGLLFAAGAIASGYILFRQSGEHRRQVRDALAQQRADFEATIAEYSGLLDTLVLDSRARLEVEIAEQRKRLEGISDEAERLSTQKEIARLEHASDALQLPPVIDSSEMMLERARRLLDMVYGRAPGSSKRPSISHHKCLQCGYDWQEHEQPDDPERAFVQCPSIRCGADQRYMDSADFARRSREAD